MEPVNLPFALPTINISGDSVASLAFFLVAIFVGVSSAILLFHWSKYGLGGKVLRLMEFLYFGVTTLLLGVAFLGLN